ncbi:MAG TPA: anti-sigma factor [Anaerolineales bacterium]|jgi:anti-sigma-K factor RskA|nr:anti-sigma factor [Anaerolineales bacterium]
MSNLPHETHIHDLLPGYAIGSLDADELKRVEEHLSSCWICRNELSAFQTVADELAFAAPLAAPSADAKERLMQRVQSARPKEQERPVHTAPARPFWERLLPAWGLASLFLILGLAASSFVLWQRVNNPEFATAPGGMRAVPLSATDAAPGATGFVLISADGDDGALVVDGLPPLGEEQEYQLWLIRDGERTSGAVFSTDERSYAGMRIRAPRSLLDYSAVGITIEPTGGSPNPTGAQVLRGTLRTP